jgi:alpha-1,2-mannosyltransferase
MSVQVTVLLVAIVVAVMFAFRTIDQYFSDLSIYFGAINAWVHGGQFLYDYTYHFEDDALGFTYPPFAAILMLPMAVLPWSVVVVALCALTALAALAVVSFFVPPIARRLGWHPVIAVVIGVCAVATLDCVDTTVTFGQVNLILLAVGVADLYLLRRGSRLAGVGIGLATAIKVTPGLFIVYLLLARRWRAAGTAAATFIAATLASAVVSVRMSVTYWTTELWSTNRVGKNPAYYFNQSLNAVIARANHGHVNTPLWAAACVVVLAVWVWRVRQSASVGDDLTGFAITAAAACLISPITWVHHLVWLIPALILLADVALLAQGRRRWVLAAVAVAAWLVFASKAEWHFADGGGIVAMVGVSAYVWVSIGLLFLPAVRRGDRDSAGTDQPAHTAGWQPIATGDGVYISVTAGRGAVKTHVAVAVPGRSPGSPR